MNCTPKYDPAYAKRAFNLIKRLGGHTIFFDDVKIIGEENLYKNPNRQRLYLANHLSHADYMITWLKFHEKGIKMPMIPAGKNLDQLFFRLIGFDFGKMGGFWVDRGLLHANKNGNHTNKNGNMPHGLEIKKNIQELLSNNLDLLNFPQGGRDYSGNVMDTFLNGILRMTLRTERDIDLINIAFDYDERIEENVFKHLAQQRKLMGIKYQFWDYFAFVKRFITKKFNDVGNAYMNISSPVPLIEITGIGELEEKVERLKQHSIKGIKRLYREIRNHS